MADPGESPPPPPPLFLDQTEARRAEKSLFGDQAPHPPYLSVWMTGPPLSQWSGSGSDPDNSRQIIIHVNEKHAVAMAHLLDDVIVHPSTATFFKNRLLE